MLLCPWDSPGKNTGVGCHFLLQGIFLTQGSNLHLLHWQVESLPVNYLGSPLFLLFFPLFSQSLWHMYDVCRENLGERKREMEKKALCDTGIRSVGLTP